MNPQNKGVAFSSLLAKVNVTKSDSPKKVGKPQSNPKESGTLDLTTFRELSTDDKLNLIMATVVGIESRVSALESGKSTSNKSDDSTHTALLTQKAAIIKLSGAIKGLSQRINKLDGTPNTEPEPEEISRDQVLGGLLAGNNAFKLRNGLGVRSLFGL